MESFFRPVRAGAPVRRRPRLIVLAVLGGAAYYLAPRFERDAPQVKLTPDTDAIGMAPLEIIVTDRGAGLKSVTATLSTGGSERTLASEDFSQATAEQRSRST